MLTRIYWFAFVFISVLFVANLQTPLASTTANVNYDGKRLSVRADGVALEQVLSMVEKQTGVRFSYDTISAETIVYANFENNTLADGIKRILLQFNHAMVYDGSGHIRTVLVLNRQIVASLRNHRNQGELDVSQPLDKVPENDVSNDNLFVSIQDEEAEAFSEQAPGQTPAGQLAPPGGEPSIPTQAPPGAENHLTQTPLDQGNESTSSSSTKEQVFSQPDDQTYDLNRVPDDDLSEPPDVYENGPGLAS